MNADLLMALVPFDEQSSPLRYTQLQHGEIAFDSFLSRRCFVV
jgi:hypothetical protein